MRGYVTFSTSVNSFSHSEFGLGAPTASMSDLAFLYSLITWCVKGSSETSVVGIRLLCFQAQHVG